MYRNLRFAPALLLLSLSACAAPSKPAEDAPPAGAQGKYAAESPEGHCLNDANAERTPDPNAPEHITVAHILVRHMLLDHPDGATRSRGEACLRALAALEALQGGAEWNDVVSEYSDAGQSTHGKLGRIAKDQVTGSFGDAAFSLAPNELSYVVESDRGFHIILRID